MHRRFFFPLFLSLALFGAGCGAKSTETPSTGSTPPPSSDTASSTVMSQPLHFPGILPAAEVNKKIRIKTTMGDIVIQLDANMGPRAASNFIYLVQQSFYNGTIFHRVIPGFMIQGGDPTGTGMGGPGYEFDDDEVKNLPVKDVSVGGRTMHAPVYEKGMVAMAKPPRPNSNGSQFFIMVADYPLGPDYSLFGRVVEGQDIADKISKVDRDSEDRPDQEVKMISVSVE
jgi:cyclophilin family peptidyl-prolyl cis-trans isomerase